MRKTTIKRGFIRGIQTKQFEQFTVVAEDIEEFEFSTDKERDEREEKFTKKVLDDFIKAYNMACVTLGVDRCIAVVNDKTTAPKSKSGAKKSDVIKEAEEIIEAGDEDYDFFDEK